MGILKVGTVEKPSGDPVDLTKQDGVKAWVNYQTTTSTGVHESLNVSSLVDNGTGDTDINFTNNFASTTYAMFGAAKEDHGGSPAASRTTVPYREASSTNHMRVLNTAHSTTKTDCI